MKKWTFEPEKERAFTDPSRSIYMWRDFGERVRNRITGLQLSEIYSEEQLEMLLRMLMEDLMEMFELWIFIMMDKGILFATEEMARVSPDYRFATQWTPADDTLLDSLLKGCNEYLTNWTEDVRTEAAKQMDIGIKAGESLTQIGDRVAEVVGAQKERGTLIARTEMMRAFNRAAKERYEQAGFAMKWITACDPVVCEICEPLDGKAVPEETGGIEPPAHPNCRCIIAPTLSPTTPSEEAIRMKTSFMRARPLKHRVE